MIQHNTLPRNGLHTAKGFLQGWTSEQLTSTLNNTGWSLAERIGPDLGREPDLEDAEPNALNGWLYGFGAGILQDAATITGAISYLTGNRDPYSTTGFYITAGKLITNIASFGVTAARNKWGQFEGCAGWS